jgi:hypothetical protein
MTNGGTNTEPSDVEMQLKRSETLPTPDQVLWVVIRNTTNAISFNQYEGFIDAVMGGRHPDGDSKKAQLKTVKDLGDWRALPFPGVEPYGLLRAATEVFLMTKCGVNLDHRDTHGNQLPFPESEFDEHEESSRLNRTVSEGDITMLWRKLLGTPDTKVEGPVTIPYLALIRRRLKEVDSMNIKDKDEDLAEVCQGILQRKLTMPCLLELIWSYWHEEAMLVQTLNAVSLRFQNIRASDRDPLRRFDIDPLRGLSNLLWGYIQDEEHRLTVPRRAHEYEHHYGLILQGKATPGVQPADSRSKFLEAFHNLLHLSTIFFRQNDDTTVIADGFPILNALREVHLLLTEGAHNQFGDLPATAREEMLIQQWMLARPEMCEFLKGRVMVPYPENWMDRVDTMKALQGWTDITVIHFRDLAVYGEQILLSVRYGVWSSDPAPAATDQAANWARYWRPEIQAYIDAYRAVTGVDLNAGD